MKIRNIEQLRDFNESLRACENPVWLVTPWGTRCNARSLPAQDVIFGELLSSEGESFSLRFEDRSDEIHFIRFFRKHPEVQ